MSVLEFAKKRYSVRNYENRAVENEKLEKIIEAAHVAPTAANLQPVRLIVVQEKENMDKLGKAANTYDAPVAIIVCADHSKAWTRPFDGKSMTDIDATILTDHMMVEEFNLPKHLEPINILALGYADEKPADSERHKNMRIPVEELVTYC